MRGFSVVIFLFLFLSVYLNAQVDASVNISSNKDSSKVENKYYTDLTNKLLLKFTNNIKYTGLQITNKNTKKTVKLAPAGGLDLGFGFN